MTSDFQMNSSIDSDNSDNQRDVSEGSDVQLPQRSVLTDEEYLRSKDIFLQDRFQSRLGDNFAVIVSCLVLSSKSVKWVELQQEMAIMLNSALLMDPSTMKTGCSALELEQRLRLGLQK